MSRSQKGADSKNEDGGKTKTIVVQVDDCNCDFHHKISVTNAKEVAEFKDTVLEMAPFFMQSLVQHTQQLIQKHYENDSGDTGTDELILDGDQGIIVSDTDSDTAVTEDDRFRLAVPPVARAMQKLLMDLNEACLKIRQKQPHLKKHARRSSFDAQRMGLRFAFHEGLGFVEYSDVVGEQEVAQETLPSALTVGTEIAATKEEVKGEPPSPLTAGIKHTKALHRITCEMKITKTWQEAGDLEGIQEERSSDESDQSNDFELPSQSESPRTSPILAKHGSKLIEPPEITKQKSSKNRGATGHKKSEDSVGISNRKQTTFKV